MRIHAFLDEIWYPPRLRPQSIVHDGHGSAEDHCVLQQLGCTECHEYQLIAMASQNRKGFSAQLFELCPLHVFFQTPFEPDRDGKLPGIDNTRVLIENETEIYAEEFALLLPTCNTRSNDRQDVRNEKERERERESVCVVKKAKWN